ncbi:MAG: hypothetical protein CBC38_01415 [Gammaproteobacteria bacterium TMED78]|nr:MAG: hypothetical protein CBC38_01415 [Gammaproteobacteria bacterium TMED78]|tara:strand:+ start:677 stop:1066 length:390 start_codon:yes stop_codon:yes gene_type:complete
MSSNISAQQVREACQEMISKDFFVIFTRPVKKIKEILELLEEHLKYQIDLEKKGILFAAGPFWSEDNSSWSGEGMIIIKANNYDDAFKIASSDPMHKSGSRSFKVKPWMLCEGSMTIELNHSSRTYKIK